MDGEPPVAALEQLMSEKGERLLRTAILLAGSRADGEDLLQSALVRVMDSWRKIDDLEGYLRRTLTNLAIDGWRRRTSWRARLGLIAIPESAPDESTAVDFEWLAPTKANLANLTT
jgi:DNA-directed RNA polymerase specialized sigma24 family protein